MKANEYIQHDAVGLAELIRRREISALEACQAALAVHEATDPAISAVIEIWPEDIVPAIAAADEDSALYGVPFLIKDILLTMEGKKCEDGARLGEGFVAAADSELMRRFRRSGLITFGRNKTPEMGFSATTEPVFPGPARNPWNPAYSTGGSSGGAAAAVGARVVPVGHASDGGGSIRIPAACCGLVGLKPSRGRVSAAPAYDEVLCGFGTEFVVSRTVRDTALMLDLVHGPAVGEPYEIAAPGEPFVAAIARPAKRLKIGLLPHPLNGGRSTPQMVAAVEEAARLCASLGHEVVPAAPALGMSWEAFMDLNATIWCAGLVTWIDGLAEATGRAVDESSLEPQTLAAYAHGKRKTASDLLAALGARNSFTRSFAAFFQDHDLLLNPSLPGLTAPLSYFADWGETGLDWTRKTFAYSPFTPAFNVSGLPALSLPLAHDAATGLPIGIHFGAGFGKEADLLQLAAQLEQAAPWAARMPAICSAL